MSKAAVTLVGCGNITATRHIPALRRLGSVEVIGVVGTFEEGVEGAAQAVRAFAPAAGPRKLVADLTREDLPGWLAQSDLIVVGTPPSTHAAIALRLAEAAPSSVLLVEKPLVVTLEDRAGMATLAERSPAAMVMHNFQFAPGFRRASSWIASGSIGELRSIQAYQWSTKARRLPVWYRELPLGLFWDEAAHFLYLTAALAGKLHVESSAAFPGSDQADPTPSVLTAMLLSESGLPVEIAMHFDAGISEWGVIASGSAGTVIYDLFRDIAIRLPYDGLHLGKQVLRTSLFGTTQHWGGMLTNGLRRVSGNLHYGIDQVLTRAVAVTNGELVDPRLSIAAGLQVTDLMRDITLAAQNGR
jgi:scyllo-inositol 2-dehydrogenase (NADP+)